MTTATDLPLLAMLGKGAEPAVSPLAAAGDDDRALDAALEFAALLLEAGVSGGDDEAGKLLPETGGKTLPGEPATDEPAAPLAEAVPAGVLEPIVRRGLPGPLGDAVAGQIRSAQGQPAVLQRTAPGTPGMPAAAVAPQAAAEAPVAGPDIDPVANRSPETPPGLAALARVETTRRTARSAVDSTRGALDALSALRAGVASAPPREGAAVATTPATSMPQVAGPEAMLGEAGWTRQFAERVGWVIHARVPQAQLSLNPEHLGPIEMAIEVEDATARVQFTAAHAVTREAIEQSLPRLREMLEQQGLDLAQANVGADSNPARGDGAGDADADRAAGSAAGRAADAEADEPGATGDVAAPVLRLRPRGLVDTFV